uniref:tRNA pseudouridine(13) synthase TruD n=1 Tax=candidate division WOR-3 bacterium TaxID=2052148 RepID=A0A7C4GG74_UNCW3
MKVKCRPDDFRVEEVVRLRLKPRGAYSVYRLEKRGWNTLDVIRHLETRHGLRRLSRAGLKDRHSHSTQFLSLPGRGPREIREANYTLRLAGMADAPVTREVLVGNRFRIILRALTDGEREAVRTALPSLRRFGVPNYYDEQRLGSARHGQGFIARKLIDGHFNGALRLHLATPSAADDSRTRRQKAALAANWGDWSRCLDYCPAEARPALEHLRSHPKDFERAVTLLPRALLELFVNAYQAWLWNETMVALLKELDVPVRMFPYSFGNLAFYNSLSPAAHTYLRRLTIPAAGPKAIFTSERVARVTAEVLAREQLELARLKLRLRLKGLFFKPYPRLAMLQPRRLSLGEAEPDELYPGRSRLTLSFFLPAGSYATVVVKRLSIGA